MERNYDSDGSTLVNEERQRRRRPQMRYRSPSAESRRSRWSYYDERPRSFYGERPRSYYDEQQRSQKQGSSRYETLGKVALVFGLLQLVGGIIQLYNLEKHKERDREHRRQKRKAFERAKEKRRREEEKRERSMEDDDSENEFSRPRVVRQIGYGPVRSHSSGSERSERRIDPPREESRRRSRGPSRAGSRYGRDGRATSRMR